jgi:hypothetical protein
MTANDNGPFDGGCDSRHVCYRMTSRPMFVHCCHCRWCQRETGASFALNTMIESECVGAEDEPQCKLVCPADCIVQNPDFEETPEQLLAKYESLHG